MSAQHTTGPLWVKVTPHARSERWHISVGFRMRFFMPLRRRCSRFSKIWSTSKGRYPRTLNGASAPMK